MTAQSRTRLARTLETWRMPLAIALLLVTRDAATRRPSMVASGEYRLR